MHDLRTTLRVINNRSYRVQHTNVCTCISPAAVYTNQFPPPQDLISQIILKKDCYSVSWRCSSDSPSGLQRAELFVFLDSLSEPALVYDLRTKPEFSVVFKLPKSSPVYVMVRVQSKSVFRIHTLHVMVARDNVVGYDPLMHEWDMEKVGAAIHYQHVVKQSLYRLTSMFEWDDIKCSLRNLMDKWCAVFDGMDDNPNNHHSVGTYLHCRLQAPQFLATSRDSHIGSLHCDEHGEWTLHIMGVTYQPSYAHAQYFIWCFPEKQIKFSLRRDTPTHPDTIDFTIKGNDCAQTPVWFWLGYNFMGNLPFYNWWSVCVNTLEFVNRGDLLELFDILENHFQISNLDPLLVTDN